MKSVYLTVWALAFMLACFCSGCLTSATAYTEKTAPDGTVTVSKVKIIGTGDKASQVAAEGLFADGGDDALGAGVKTASASQQSTGIDGTLNGLANLLFAVDKLRSGGGAGVTAQSAAAVPDKPAAEAQNTEAAEAGDTLYTAEGFDGSPGSDGSGVYGHPSCSRCRAYLRNHPGVKIINTDVAENEAALRKALKDRGFTGSIGLPVEVTAPGYTLMAK